MFNLTRQQQTFLCLLLFFLALGWGVKAWRTAHPPAQSVAPAGGHRHAENAQAVGKRGRGLDDLRKFVSIRRSQVVLSRAKQCLEAGCDGVISSGLEVPKLRAAAGHKLLVVAPGIRPVDNKPVGDQKRVVSVETAFATGCDYIVMGRPIRDAANPRAAAEAVQASIAARFARELHPAR